VRGERTFNAVLTHHMIKNKWSPAAVTSFLGDIHKFELQVDLKTLPHDSRTLKSVSVLLHISDIMVIQLMSLIL